MKKAITTPRREMVPWIPRGLNRADAAYYIGVGTTKFDDMVKDGRMPAGKKIDSRTVWDRKELDAAFDALPDSKQNETGEDPWANFAV